MKKRGTLTIVSIAAVVILGGVFVYRFSHVVTGAKSATEEKKEAVAGRPGDEEKEGKEGKDREIPGVRLKPEILQSSAVVVETAKKASLGGVIIATGKVEGKADRTAHVAPRIPGNVA